VDEQYSHATLNSTAKISEKDLSSSPHQLGAGRFGTCYLSTLSHYQVCVKVFKSSNNSALCNEANVLSKFVHHNLPYLCGVCLSKPAIVTSFHEFDDRLVTLHHALFTQSKEMQALLGRVDWLHVLQQILTGLRQMHIGYRVLHNNLKGDKVVLKPTLL